MGKQLLIGFPPHKSSSFSTEWFSISNFHLRACFLRTTRQRGLDEDLGKHLLSHDFQRTHNTPGPQVLICKTLP